MVSLPDVEFQGSQRGFGSRVESWVSAWKLVGVGLVAVLMVAVINLNHPFFGTPDQGEGRPDYLAQNKVNDPIPAQENFTRDEQSDETHQTGVEGGQGIKIALHVDGGVVQVKTSNGYKIVKDGSSFDLSPFDEIQTGASASAALVYPDENIRLKLKPMSRVQVAQNRLRLYQGNTWVHVVKKGTKFEVHTSNLIAAVRGTVFSVGTAKVRNDLRKSDPLAFQSSVAVYEGRVWVDSKTTDTEGVILSAGEQVLSQGVNLGQKNQVDYEKDSAWKSEVEEMDLKPEISDVTENIGPRNDEVKPTDSFDAELK